MDTVDVVIIGAGAAGLACAQFLAHAGRAVTVLEARKRIGGRVNTLRTPDGDIIELGAQVVHTTDDQTLVELVTRTGIHVSPFAINSGIVVVHQGVRWDAADLSQLQAPPPWVVERKLATEYFRQGTVESALAVLPDNYRVLATAWIEQVVGGDCRVLDVQGVVLDHEMRHPGEELVVNAGFDTVIGQLAHGLDIRLDSAVEVIRWSQHGVEIESGEISAKAAVVTVPPSVLSYGGLRFQPVLPPEKYGALPTLASTDATAVVLTAAAPVDRSVWAMLVDPPGGLWWTKHGSRYVVGHLKGPATARAREWGWTADHTAEIAAAIDPAIGPITSVGLRDWGTDPWARGAYTIPVSGIDDASNTWAEPVGDVLFFAGEATAQRGLRGLVQGAITSGRRAAHAVLGRVGHRPHVDRRTGR